MKKINKTAARKLWNNGGEFWITPCNFKPEYGIYIKESWKEQFVSFDKMVNNFEYYNCDNERGRYAAYYTAD